MVHPTFTSLSASMFHVPRCMLYSVSCIPPAGGSSVPREPIFYHLLTVVPQLGVSLMRPWNSLKFQAISNTSQNHQNGTLRPPKNSKMVSKVVPETIQIMKTLKMRNLMKTTIFTILLRGWDIRKPLCSIQNSSKNMPAMQIIFSPSKSQNISKSDSKWTPIGDP